MPGRRPLPATALAALALILLSAPAPAMPALHWPTTNRALVEGRPQDFFQYVDRNFEGRASRPWEGGTFGFVRSPVRIGDRVVYTRFHEGIDVKPVVFNARGVPVDPILAIADGRVAHVSRIEAHSTYGLYLVIEHRFPSGPFYSLYSHLASISVDPGQRVRAGQQIGVMGWSGPGLDQRRAHLHLELCLLLHTDFPRWHEQFAPGVNRHGIHNGINLIGFNLAPLYQAQHDGHQIRLSEFITRHRPAYRVRTAVGPRFELPGRYPWLAGGRRFQAPGAEITFTRDGMPVLITPLADTPAAPVVAWVDPQGLPLDILSNRRLQGTASQPRLSPSGQNFIRLVTGNF